MTDYYLYDVCFGINVKTSGLPVKNSNLYRASELNWLPQLLQFKLIIETSIIPPTRFRTNNHTKHETKRIFTKMTHIIPIGKFCIWQFPVSINTDTTQHLTALADSWPNNFYFFIIS